LFGAAESILMRVNPEQLPAQLKRGLESLYTITGEELFLSLEAADRIRAAARGQGCSERVVLEVNAQFSWAELAIQRASLSLFSAKRLVEVRIPSGKPGAEGAAALTQCTTPQLDVVMLVIIPTRLDRQTEASNWFRALERAGVVVDVRPVSRERLPQWIAGRLAQQGQQASADTLRFIAERVEGNLLAAHQEVLKLGLLLPEGPLAFDDVKDAVLDVARYDVFKLGEAMLAGDCARLARFLEGLESEGVAPPLVLWAMADQIRALAKVAAGVVAGRSIATSLDEAKVSRPRQQLVKHALQRFSLEQLEDALIDAARIDKVIKGIEKGNPWDELQRLALRIARGNAQVETA
jgi:DNA polymerase-3 subunit delta